MDKKRKCWGFNGLLGCHTPCNEVALNWTDVCRDCLIKGHGVLRAEDMFCIKCKINKIRPKNADDSNRLCYVCLKSV